MDKVRVGKGKAVYKLAMGVIHADGVDGEEFTRYRANDLALAYSVLTTMGRKRVTWSTKGLGDICQELDRALLGRFDEDDDSYNETYIKPDHDAYDALVAELKAFAKFMVSADSPQNHKDLQARIMALPSAAEKLERGEIYEMHD